ncbi:hypothetical protein Tco_1523256 [Tanacetum coccineum]
MVVPNTLNSLQFVSKNTPNGQQICYVEKFLSTIESEKKAKLVCDEMVEYVLAKYGKDWKCEYEIADVILETCKLNMGKGKVKVDDLQNRVKRLEGDLTRAEKGKLAEHDKGKAKQAKDYRDDGLLKETPTTPEVLEDNLLPLIQDLELPFLPQHPELLEDNLLPLLQDHKSPIAFTSHAQAASTSNFKMCLGEEHMT